MDNSLSKHRLIAVATAIRNDERVEVAAVEPFPAHTFEELSPFSRFMLKVAAGLSLFFASVLVPVILSSDIFDGLFKRGD